MNESRARLMLGVTFPIATLGIIVVPYLMVRSDFPDRVASHFDGSGTPDGSMPAGVFIAITAALAVFGLAGCVWLALSRKPLPDQVATTAGFFGGFIAGTGSGIALVTMITQRGIDTWEDAANVWTTIAVPVLMGAGAGALGAWLARHLPLQTATHTAGQQPTMDLRDGEHAVWTETLQSRWLTGLGTIATVAGVVVAIGTFWWLIVPLVVTGVAMISLANIRVRADRAGLQLRYGLLPWPRTTIAIDELERATVIDVRPMEWGGWGYRGSLKLANQATVVHRAGPGIRLDLRNGKVFAVTVDRPEQAVALLNGEIARTRASV